MWRMRIQVKNQKNSDAYFHIYLSIVSLMRLFLVHDVELPIVNAPHDGSLYISRAYYLVTAGNFGPYDGRLLIKDMSSSILIAISRLLGFDYLSFLNLLHIIAAVYFATGLVRIGLSRRKSGILFALALFAPLTLSDVWFSVNRENLDSILYFFFFSALTLGLATWRRKASPLDTFVLCVSGAAVFFLREESVLLLALIAGFFGVELLRWWGAHRLISLWPRKNRVIRASMLLLLTIGLFKTGLMILTFVDYGTFVTNDLQSGNFVRFITALRSASGPSQQPFVAITGEGLRRVAQQVPSVASVVAGLPPPPDPGSEIARRFGVMGEWDYGHLIFWIKDAAFGAGLTPNAHEAQRFFRSAADDIERACAAKALTCIDESTTLLPPVRVSQLGHIWVGINDGLRNVVRLENVNRAADLEPSGEASSFLRNAETASFQDDIKIGRMHQFVGKIAFDSLGQAALLTPKDSSKWDLSDLTVRYWCRYSDIALSDDYGVVGSLTPEFYSQFATALGLRPVPTNIEQIKDLDNDGRIEKFLSSIQSPNCLTGNQNTVVAAMLYFLRERRGKTAALLTASPGGYRHFLRYGQGEGRTFYDSISFSSEATRDAALAVVRYRPFTINIRSYIVENLEWLNPVIFATGLISLLCNFRRSRRDNVLLEPVAIIITYGALKIVALAYVAISVGLLDPRLYASLNYAMMMFTAAFVAFNPFLSKIRNVVVAIVHMRHSTA